MQEVCPMYHNILVDIFFYLCLMLHAVMGHMNNLNQMMKIQTL